ncbi:MAG: hypothetical protein WCK85_11550 [Chlorobium sp.]
MPVIAWMFSLMLFFSACQSVATLTPAETFNQGVANAIAVENAIIQTTTNLLNAQIISKEMAQYVLTEAKKADGMIAEARSLSKTDLTTAQGRLNIALNSLTDLREYLDKKGAK